MAKKHFTEEQVSQMVHENAVYTVEHEDRRWTKSVTAIVEDEDGKLYEMYWEKGLTESQENEYFADDFEEVFKVVTNVGTISTQYLTERQINNLKESLSKGFEDEVNSLKVVADEEAVLKESESVDIAKLDEVINMIKNIELLNLSSKMVVNNSIAIEYLENLKDIKGLLS